MYVVCVECVMLWLCWFICLGKYMLFVWKWELCAGAFVRYRFIINRIHFSKVMHLLGWVSDFSKLGYAFDNGHMSEYEVRKEKGRRKIIESIPTPKFMPDCCFSAKLHLIIIEQHKKQTVLQQISIYFGSLRTQFSVKLRFAIYFFQLQQQIAPCPFAHINTYWMKDWINERTG